MNRFNLHTYLKKVCVIKDLKLADVARNAGLSVQNLSGILTNDNATLKTVAKIAEAIDCDLDIQFIDKATGSVIKESL